MVKFILIIAFYFFPFFLLAQDSTMQSSDTLMCGNATIIFKTRCEENLPRISFVHVHEDEITAVAAANWLLDTVRKGCFVTWQCQQDRFVHFTLNDIPYRFDPNRIYTTAGIIATLKSNDEIYSATAADTVKAIADSFLKKYIDSNLLVIALHNNSERGGLSINSYKKGAVYGKDAKAVFVNPQLDADDFFYTTELSFFNFLRTKKYNVVLQDNVKVTDDGSLSVCCSGKKIPYINIEAQNGHLQQQKKMLKVVWELIEKLVKTKIEPVSSD